MSKALPATPLPAACRGGLSIRRQRSQAGLFQASVSSQKDEQTAEDVLKTTGTQEAVRFSYQYPLMFHRYPSVVTHRGGWKMILEGKVTRDHEFIQKWVDQRGGVPSIEKKISGTEILTNLMINFSDNEESDWTSPISWDQFFALFEEQDLVFLYQEYSSSGSISRTYNFL